MSRLRNIEIAKYRNKTLNSTLYTLNSYAGFPPSIYGHPSLSHWMRDINKGRCPGRWLSRTWQ